MSKSPLAWMFATLLAASGAWAQAPLPDGPAKHLVETRCVGCHELSRVTGAGYTAPVVIPGDTKIVIREWIVPTAGSRPHDPATTPDGALWYTGQYNNVLGRLDPKTGTFKEFPLKTPQSGPHGLTADRDGNIWYTGNSKGLIGKLDPKTGVVTEYPMPDPAARDPHTPIFDQKGIVWFTVQSANRIGRLDPRTGEVKLVTAPTARSRPYGVLVNSKNIPWYSEAGVKPNTLVRFDPQAQKFQTWAIPSGGGVVRHMVRPRRALRARAKRRECSRAGREAIGRHHTARYLRTISSFAHSSSRRSE